MLEFHHPNHLSHLLPPIDTGPAAAWLPERDGSESAMAPRARWSEFRVPSSEYLRTNKNLKNRDDDFCFVSWNVQWSESGILGYVYDILGGEKAEAVRKVIRKTRQLEIQKKYTFGLDKTKYMVEETGTEKKEEIKEI